MAPGPQEVEAWVKQVEQVHARLAERLPDIPPEDLLLIVQSMLRPASWGRRIFLRQLTPGVYVP